MYLCSLPKSCKLKVTADIWNGCRISSLEILPGRLCDVTFEESFEKVLLIGSLHSSLQNKKHQSPIRPQRAVIFQESNLNSPAGIVLVCLAALSWLWTCTELSMHLTLSLLDIKPYAALKHLFESGAADKVAVGGAGDLDCLVKHAKQ